MYVVVDFQDAKLAILISNDFTAWENRKITAKNFVTIQSSTTKVH